jgi:hypothetical protein
MKKLCPLVALTCQLSSSVFGTVDYEKGRGVGDGELTERTDVSVDVPLLNLEDAFGAWIKDIMSFDISPIFNEHIANFSPVAKSFVDGIIQLDIEKCAELAKSHFQSRATEEAVKCMELLAVVAGWPAFSGGWELIKQIKGMYNKKEVTIGSIKYKEFVGDVMYMGLYTNAVKVNNEGEVPKWEENVDKDVEAEFFRWLAYEMYERIPGKLSSLYEGGEWLGIDTVSYSTTPEYYPSDVWKKWYSEPGSE